MTEHEANNALVFVSDKLWQSLSADQKQWVMTAAAEVSAKEPAKAFELEKAAAAKLKGFGVKIVEDVDKKSFADDRRSLSRQARQGARAACGEDQEPDPGDQLTGAHGEACALRASRTEATYGPHLPRRGEGAALQDEV